MKRAALFLLAVALGAAGMAGPHVRRACAQGEAGAQRGAAPPVTVRGVVRSAATGEPLAGANVLVRRLAGDSLRRGTAAGGDGAFRFEALPPGEYTVRASYLSYEPATQQVTLPGDSTRRLTFSLAPAPLEAESVVITDERAEAAADRALGAERLTPSQIKNLPTPFEPDVFRALQLLPGVKASSDFSSGLYIRGGSPDQTLVRLDGTTVYNPTHFFGFFSTFNPDAIGDVRLYKGGFPAEYGGRLGAVVDLQNRQGVPEETSGAASVGLLASRIAGSGPLPSSGALPEGSSWMLAARRSTLEPLFAALRRQDVDGIPNRFYFYDLNGRADVPLSPNDRLTVSGYAGADYIDFPFLDDARAEIPYGNRMGSLRWTRLWGERAFSRVGVSASRYFSRPSFNLSGNVFRRTNELTDLSASADLEVEAGAHTVRGGARGSYFTSALERSLDGDVLFSPELETGRLAGYVQDTWRPGSGGAEPGAWKLTAGLRASYQTRGQHLRLAPRVAVEYRPPVAGERLYLQAGYGRYQQFLTLQTSELFSGADTWYLSGEDVPPAYGDQFVAGLKADLPGPLRLDVEGYYRTMRDLFQIDPFTQDAAGLPYAEAFQFGEGYAYGMEAKLERTEGPLTGFLAYTLAQTRRRFPFVNLGNQPSGGGPERGLTSLNARNVLGGAYPPKYDRRHDLKAVLNVDFADQWRATSVFTYATGQPYTRPQSQFKLVAAPQRTSTLNALVSPFNGARLPPYHRLDLGVRRLGTLAGLDYELQVQLLNVYNRRNIWFYFYEFEDDNNIDRQEVPQLPIPLPNVALTIEF